MGFNETEARTCFAGGRILRTFVLFLLFFYKLKNLMYQVYSLQYILSNIIYSTGNEYNYEQLTLTLCSTLLDGRISPGKGETAALPRAGHSARFSISGR